MSTSALPGRGFDLLKLPLLGRFLRWRHARAALQLPLLVVAILVICDGFTGPPLAPRNLAGVMPWVQWRGLTVLSLLLAASLFCTACPFMLVRRLAKRLMPADRPWPKFLQGKWVALALLFAFFWFYEAFDPWAMPWLTASLATAYFAAAFAVDGLFKGAAFCKYLCPIGQFNFVNSTLSPLEIRVRRPEPCESCSTKDCIRGGHGCELWLFQQRKVGNLDCTFCLDCLHACPADNVGVVPRPPGSELWLDRRRAGVGRLAERPDLAAMALVVVFAAFMNAFGMVTPFYGFEAGVARSLGNPPEWVTLLVIFGATLLMAPAATVGLAALASRALSGSSEPLATVATRYSYSLIPVGFGMWLAHYGFHFLTGGLTLVPVAQDFLAGLGIPLLGTPRWGLAALVPASWLLPLEFLFLEAGMLVSLVVSYRVAQSRHPSASAALRAFLPWALLAICLFAVGVWLMLQPMEMRGVISSG